MPNLETNVRSWYISNYPSDTMGAYIDPKAIFNTVFEALDNYKNIYTVLGDIDSIIRERVFQALSKIIGTDYNYVYEQWLKGGN